MLEARLGRGQGSTHDWARKTENQAKGWGCRFLDCNRPLNAAVQGPDPFSCRRISGTLQPIPPPIPWVPSASTAMTPGLTMW